jgi:8-oxo-dGTP diphosphatase
MIKKVVAGIIFKDNKILIAQRKGGKHDGLWEFPGGKIEENETPIEALKRELIEELDINVSIKEFFCNTVYDYGDFILDMDCYICELLTNEYDVKLNVHNNFILIKPEKINQEMLLPADIDVLNKIINDLN